MNPAPGLLHRRRGWLLRLVGGNPGGPPLPCFGRVMTRFGATTFPDDPGIGPGGRKESDQDRNDHELPSAVPRTPLPVALCTGSRILFMHAFRCPSSASHPMGLSALRR